MERLLLLMPLVALFRPRREKPRPELSASSTQTRVDVESIKVQTDTRKYRDVKIRNRPVRPSCLARPNHKHGDWFLRKFCLKNKIIIYNNTDYEIDAYITPRNIMSAVGIKGVGGDFNNEYEEEVYVIPPKGKLRLRNYPTLSYYMKLSICSFDISKKLYFANDDIVISSKKNVENSANCPCE